MRTILAKKIVVTMLLSLFILSILSPLCFCIGTVQGWQIADSGGSVSETNGVITLSDNDQAAGSLLYKEISPQSDFEISLQVKAATLGEVDRDPLGGGEGFQLMLSPRSTSFAAPIVVSFELRARGGGQFLLARQNNLRQWDWTPFVYNTLEYNNGYSYWHSSPSSITENALIKPNVWYTMKLEVQESPFIITAKVINETGAMLGSFSASDVIGFTFQDIRFIGISSCFGGEFYVRNISETGFISEDAAKTQISIFPEVSSPTLGSIISINGRLADSNGTGLANELVVLYYSFPGIDQWLPISSVLTNETGDYSVQWVNTASGNFVLRAVWSGNLIHLGSSNTTVVSVLPYQNQAVFFVESNSTVTDLAFNSTSSELGFSVKGPSGTTGFVRATVAKSLVASGADLKVYLDGNQLAYSVTSLGDSWLVMFSYSHSTHKVSIKLLSSIAQSVPEFLFWIVLSLLIVAVIIGGLLIYFKKRKH